MVWLVWMPSRLQEECCIRRLADLRLLSWRRVGGSHRTRVDEPSPAPGTIPPATPVRRERTLDRVSCALALSGAPRTRRGTRAVQRRNAGTRCRHAHAGSRRSGENLRPQDPAHRPVDGVRVRGHRRNQGPAKATGGSRAWSTRKAATAVAVGHRLGNAPPRPHSSGLDRIEQIEVREMKDTKYRTAVIFYSSVIAGFPSGRPGGRACPAPWQGTRQPAPTVRFRPDYFRGSADGRADRRCGVRVVTPDRAVRPRDRARAGPHPDRPGEPPQQPPALRLARTPGGRRLNLPPDRQRGPTPRSGAPAGPSDEQPVGCPQDSHPVLAHYATSADIA